MTLEQRIELRRASEDNGDRTDCDLKTQPFRIINNSWRCTVSCRLLLRYYWIDFISERRFIRKCSLSIDAAHLLNFALPKKHRSVIMGLVRSQEVEGSVQGYAP